MGKPGSKASGLTRLTKSPRKPSVSQDTSMADAQSHSGERTTVIFARDTRTHTYARIQLHALVRFPHTYRERTHDRVERSS